MMELIKKSNDEIRKNRFLEKSIYENADAESAGWVIKAWKGISF